MSLFPFAAIVDQEDVKEAIILNLINPAIGGVLIDGACGTGKSTLARGAAEFADVPFYSLPINCSEDRLIGSIDIEKTMTSGIPALEEGILHKAHGGILFADDIYLLPDNVADLLQTVVSLGEIHVERDGISDVRPCKFMVFATMNSQLGQIRSSLVDHFGLYARTNSLSDGSKRLELLRRRQSFDDAPEKFREAWQLRMEIIREEIRKARELLPSVSVPTEIQDCIVKKLEQACTEGHRADLCRTGLRRRCRHRRNLRQQMSRNRSRISPPTGRITGRIVDKVSRNTHYLQMGKNIRAITAMYRKSLQSVSRFR